jgi:hypothetical protein
MSADVCVAPKKKERKTNLRSHCDGNSVCKFVHAGEQWQAGILAVPDVFCHPASNPTAEVVAEDVSVVTLQTTSGRKKERHEAPEQLYSQPRVISVPEKAARCVNDADCTRQGSGGPFASLQDTRMVDDTS